MGVDGPSPCPVRPIGTLQDSTAESVNGDNHRQKH